MEKRAPLQIHEVMSMYLHMYGCCWAGGRNSTSEYSNSINIVSSRNRKYSTYSIEHIISISSNRDIYTRVVRQRT